MPLPHTRLLVFLATAVALLGIALSNAGRAEADAAQVTVVKPNGTERPLSLDALGDSEDVVDRTYLLRSSSGDGSRTVSGFSLKAILEAAGVDPTPSIDFSYLEVLRPAGGSVLLSSQQALDPDTSVEGPPVVYATAAGTGFIRPSSGPSDDNASDCFEAPQGVRIVLSKEEQLRVRATATPLRTDPGKKVSFSATAEGAGAGEEVEFSWYFDDGNSATGANPTHSFAKPGSYKVVVSVTIPGTRTWAETVVTVQVGDPAEGGPDRKGGGKNKDKNAPDHGAATGPATGTPGEAGSASIPPPPVESFPPPAEPAPEPEPLPQPEPRPAPEPEGEPVSGLLLEEGGTAAPEPETESEGEPAAARTGTLSEKGSGDGGGLPDAAIGFVITGALLGAGGLIEARNLLR